MGKEFARNAGDAGSIPGLGRFPEGGDGNPFLALLPEESRGQRSLVGYSPRGGKESDTTEVTEHSHMLHNKPPLD